jgi:hypothetical protein
MRILSSKFTSSKLGLKSIFVCPPSSVRTKAPSAPSVVPDRRYLLTCAACQSRLGELRVGRVLPAPAAGWRHGATQWFCCVNRLDRAPDLALRETDLLYGPATCSLHRAALPSLVVANNDDGDSDSESNDKDRLRVGTCPTCGVEVGTLVEEAVECEYAALHFLQRNSCADDVTDNGRDVTTDPQLSGKPSGGKICDKDALAPAVHPAGASWGANFLAYLASRVQEAPELMPRLALSPRGSRTDRLHLWIADRQLTILRSCEADQLTVSTVRSCEADQLTVSTVSKVLFKLSAAGGEEEEELVEVVSERLYRAGLALLQESCRHFPDTVRTFQDYRVAYLSLL